MQTFDYVILGGGVAAGYAAQVFAEHNVENNRVAIVSADDVVPYQRPALSKDYLEGSENLAQILINDDDFYVQNGIHMFTGTHVNRIDTAERRLVTDMGDEIEFGQLMIATGSTPNTLDIPGAGAEGVEYLRLLDDSVSIRRKIQEAEKIVILGGGYIGMETAAVMSELNKDVTMIFPESRLMEKRFFPPELSKYFQDYFAERGVTFLPHNKPTTILDTKSKVTGVELETGKRLEADLIIAGIGVHPVEDLFHNNELKASNGLIVDEYLESNVDGIYAAGDIANYHDLLYSIQRQIGHWQNAKAQGQYAARRMLGLEDEPYINVPYFFSDVFDLSYEVWGDASDSDRQIIRGSMEDDSFGIWWLKDDRLIAAFLMDRPDAEREAAQTWIRERAVVPVNALQDESTPLDIRLQTEGA